MSEAAAEVFQDAWPEFFPKGVPPKTAEDAEGEFFRLVRVSPLQHNVFSLRMKSTRIATKNVKVRL